LARLRATALPTFLEQVYPTRIPIASPSIRLRACRCTPVVPCRRAFEVRTKSARLVSVLIFGQTETAGGPTKGLAISLTLGSIGGFKSNNRKRRLRAKLRPAFGAAVVQNATSSFCSHTCAKTVTVLTNPVGRLERALHSGVLWLMAKTQEKGFEAGLQFRPCQ